MSTQEADNQAPVCETTREHNEDPASRAATSVLVSKVAQEEKSQAETPDEPPSVEGDKFLTSPSIARVHSEAIKISAEASKVIYELVDESKTDEVKYAETKNDHISRNLTNDVSGEGQRPNDQHYVDSETKEGNEMNLAENLDAPAEKEIQIQHVNLGNITYSDPTGNVLQSKNIETQFETTVKESQGHSETQSKDLENIITIGSKPKITEEEESSLTHVYGSKPKRSAQFHREDELLSEEVSISDIKENEPLAIDHLREEDKELTKADLLEDEKDIKSSSKEEQFPDVNLQHVSANEANNENINTVDTQGKVLESVLATVSSSPEEGSIKANLQGQKTSDGIDGKTNNQFLLQKDIHQDIPVIVSKKENEENIYTEADEIKPENRDSLDEASLSPVSEGEFSHDEPSTLVSKAQLEAQGSELSGHDKSEENTLLKREKTERDEDILHAPFEHVEASNLSQETEKVSSGEQSLDAHAQGVQEENIDEKTVAIERKEELLELQIDPKVVSDETNEDNSVIQVGGQQMKILEHVEEEHEKPSHVEVFLGNNNVEELNILDATENEDGNLGKEKLTETEINNRNESLKEELEMEKSVESLDAEGEELKPLDLDRSAEKKGILAEQNLLEKPDETKVDEIVDATTDATEGIGKAQELKNVVIEMPQERGEQSLTETSTNDSNEDETILKDESYGENEHERKVVISETKKHIDSTLPRKEYSKDEPEDDTERPRSLVEQNLTANHQVVTSEDIIDTKETVPAIQNAETKTPDEKIEEKPAIQLDCSQVEPDNVSILAEAPAKESKNDESKIICDSQNRDENLTQPKLLQDEKNTVRNLVKEPELHETPTDASQAVSQDDFHQETKSSSIEEQVPTADGQKISSGDTEKITSHAAGTDHETPLDIAENVRSGADTKASVASLKEESSKESMNDTTAAIETSLVDKIQNSVGTASYEDLEESSRGQGDYSNIEQKEHFGNLSEIPSLANTSPGETIEGNPLTETHQDKSVDSYPEDTEDAQSYSSTRSKEINFVKEQTVVGDSCDKTEEATGTANSRRFEEIIVSNKPTGDFDIEMKDEAPIITGRTPSAAETQEVNQTSMGANSALITRSEKDMNEIANIGSIIEEKSSLNEAEVEQVEVPGSYEPKNQEYRSIATDQSQTKEEDTEKGDNLEETAEIKTEKAVEGTFQINEPAYEKEIPEVDIPREKIKKEDENSEDKYLHSFPEEGTTESFREDDLNQEDDPSAEERSEIIKSDGTEKVSAIQIKNEDEDFPGDYHQGSSKSEVVTGNHGDDVKEDQTEKVEDTAEAGQTEKIENAGSNKEDAIIERHLEDALEKEDKTNTAKHIETEEATETKQLSESLEEATFQKSEQAYEKTEVDIPSEKVLASPEEADQKVVEQLKEESTPTEYNNANISEKEHKSVETVKTVFDSEEAHGLDHLLSRIESEDPAEKIEEEKDANENVIVENRSEDEVMREHDTKIQEEFEITKDAKEGKLSQGLADADHEIVQQTTENSGSAKPIDRSTGQKEQEENIGTVVTLLDDKEAYGLDQAHAKTECEYSIEEIEKEEEDAKESIIVENHLEDEAKEKFEVAKHAEEKLPGGLEEDEHEPIQEPKENTGAAEPTDGRIHQKVQDDSIETVITASVRKEVYGSDHAHATEESEEESSEKIGKKEDAKEGIDAENQSEYEAKKEDNTKIKENFEVTADEKEKVSEVPEEDEHEVLQQPTENSGTAEISDRSMDQNEPAESIETDIILLDSEEAYGSDHAYEKTESENSTEKIEKEKEHGNEGIIVEHRSEDEVKKEDQTKIKEQFEVTRASNEEKETEGHKEDDREVIQQTIETSGSAEPSDRSIYHKVQAKSIETPPITLDRKEAYGLNHEHPETETEVPREKIEKEGDYAKEYQLGSTEESKIKENQQDAAKKDVANAEDEFEVTKDTAEKKQIEEVAERLEDSDQNVLQQLKEVSGAAEIIDRGIRQKEQGESIETTTTVVDSEEVSDLDDAYLKTESEDSTEKIEKQDEDAKEHNLDSCIIRESHQGDVVKKATETNTEEELEDTKDTTETEKVEETPERLEETNQKVIEQQEVSGEAEIIDRGIHEEGESIETVKTVADSEEVPGLDGAYMKTESEDSKEKIEKEEDAKEHHSGSPEGGLNKVSSQDDKEESADETNTQEELEGKKDTIETEHVGRVSERLDQANPKVTDQSTEVSGETEIIDRGIHQKEQGESTETATTGVDSEEFSELEGAHVKTESEDSTEEIQKQDENAKGYNLASSEEGVIRENHQGDVVETKTEEEVEDTKDTTETEKVEETSERLEETNQNVIKQQDVSEEAEIIDRGIHEEQQGASIETVTAVVDSEEVPELDGAYIKTEREDSKEKIEKRDEDAKEYNLDSLEEGVIRESHQGDVVKMATETNTEEEVEDTKDTTETDKTSERLEGTNQRVIKQQEVSGEAEMIDRGIQEQQGESIKTFTTVVDSKEVPELDGAYINPESEDLKEKIEKEEDAIEYHPGSPEEGINKASDQDDEVKSADETNTQEELEGKKDTIETEHVGRVSERLDEANPKVTEQSTEVSGEDEIIGRGIRQKEQGESFETTTTGVDSEEVSELDGACVKTESEDSTAKIQKQDENAKEYNLASPEEGVTKESHQVDVVKKATETNTEEEVENTQDTTEKEKFEETPERLEETNQKVIKQQEVSGEADIIDRGIHEEQQGESIETVTTVADSEEVPGLDGAYMKTESEDSKEKIQKEEDAKEHHPCSPEEGINKVNDQYYEVKSETNTQEELEGRKDTIETEDVGRVSERLDEANSKETERTAEVSGESEIIDRGIHQKQQGDSIETTTVVDSEEVSELDGAYLKTENENSTEKIEKQDEDAKEYNLDSSEEGIIGESHQGDVVKKDTETNTEEELEDTKHTTETEEVEETSGRLEETNQKVIKQQEVSGEAEIIDRGIHEEQQGESIETVTTVVDSEEPTEKEEKDESEYHLGSLKEGTVKESLEDDVVKKEDETNMEKELEVARITFEPKQVEEVSERLEEANQNVREQLKEVSGEEEQGESIATVKTVVDSEKASGLDGECIKLESEGSSGKKQIEKEEEAAKEYYLGPHEEAKIKKTDDVVKTEDETNTEEKHKVTEESNETKQVSERLEEVDQKVTEQREDDSGETEIIDRGIHQKDQGETIEIATTVANNEQAPELGSAYRKTEHEDPRKKEIEKEDYNAKEYHLGLEKGIIKENKQDHVVKQEDETNTEEELEATKNTNETHKIEKVSEELEKSGQTVKEKLKEVPEEAEITNRGIHQKEQGESNATVMTAGSEEAPGLDGEYIKAESEGPSEKIQKEEEAAKAYLDAHEEGLINKSDDLVKKEDNTNTEEKHEDIEEANELEQVFESLKEADQNVTEQPQEVPLAVETIHKGVHHREQGESTGTATTAADNAETPELDSAYIKTKIEDSREKEITQEEEDAQEYRLGSLEEESQQDDVVKKEDETNKEEIEAIKNTIETEQVEKVPTKLEDADQNLSEQLQEFSGEAEIIDRGIHHKEQGEAPRLDGEYLKTEIEGTREKNQNENEKETAKEYHLGPGGEGLIKRSHDVVKKEDEINTEERYEDTEEINELEQVSERLEEADQNVTEHPEEDSGTVEIIDRGINQKEQGESTETAMTIVDNEEAPELDGAYTQIKTDASREKHIEKEEEDAKEYYHVSLEEDKIKENQEDNVVKKEEETSTEEKLEVAEDTIQTEQVELGESIGTITTAVDSEVAPGLGGAYINTESEDPKEKIEKEAGDAKGNHFDSHEEGLIKETHQDDVVRKENVTYTIKELDVTKDTTETEQVEEISGRLEEGDQEVIEQFKEVSEATEIIDRGTHKKEQGKSIETVTNVLDSEEAPGLYGAYIKRDSEESKEKIKKEEEDANEYHLSSLEEGTIKESQQDGVVKNEDETNLEENFEATNDANETKQVYESLEETEIVADDKRENSGTSEAIKRNVLEEEHGEDTEKAATVFKLDTHTQTETKVNSSSVALTKDEENKTGAGDVHKETDKDQEMSNQISDSPLIDASASELPTKGIHITQVDSEDNREDANTKIVEEEVENKMVEESPHFPGFTNWKESKGELKDYICSSEAAPAKDEEIETFAVHIRENEVPKGDTWNKPTEGGDRNASIEAEKVDLPYYTKDNSEVSYSDSVDITPLSEKDYPDKSIGIHIPNLRQDEGLLEQASKATTVAAEIVGTEPGTSSRDPKAALDTQQELAVQATSTDEYVVVEADDAPNVSPDSSIGSKAISNILHGHFSECSQGGEDEILRPSVLEQVESGYQKEEITSKDNTTPVKKPESEETHGHSQLSLLQSSTEKTSQITDHPTIQEEPATHSEYPHAGTTYETAHKEALGDIDDEDEHEQHAADNDGDSEVQTAHKKPHSHNLLSGVGSKVKHSLDKVKKAITGKSHHSKQRSPK